MPGRIMCLANCIPAHHGKNLLINYSGVTNDAYVNNILYKKKIIFILKLAFAAK